MEFSKDQTSLIPFQVIYDGIQPVPILTDNLQYNVRIHIDLITIYNHINNNWTSCYLIIGANMSPHTNNQQFMLDIKNQLLKVQYEFETSYWARVMEIQQVHVKVIGIDVFLLKTAWIPLVMTNIMVWFLNVNQNNQHEWNDYDNYMVYGLPDSEHDSNGQTVLTPINESVNKTFIPEPKLIKEKKPHKSTRIRVKRKKQNIKHFQKIPQQKINQNPNEWPELG